MATTLWYDECFLAHDNGSMVTNEPAARWLRVPPSESDQVFREGRVYSTETFLHWSDAGIAGVELLTTTDLVSW